MISRLHLLGAVTNIKILVQWLGLLFIGVTQRGCWDSSLRERSHSCLRSANQETSPFAEKMHLNLFHHYGMPPQKTQKLADVVGTASFWHSVW